MQNVPHDCLIVAYSLQLKSASYRWGRRGGDGGGGVAPPHPFILKICVCDNCDAFGFRAVNFSFMSSSVSSVPAYGAYGTQLIRYSRFRSGNKAFVTGLQS